jgi:thiamine-monophosphate kinase
MPFCFKSVFIRDSESILLMTPFTIDGTASVGSIGETKLLKRIREWLGEATPPTPRGMGDDCAVTDGRANLITCDSLVLGRHFDEDCPPEMAGAKLLKRNLSDIAAMGGLPCEAVVAMFLPRNVSLAWVEGFTRGLAKCALDHSTLIVGGDIAESPTLAATLTLTGRARRPLTRGTGSAGDVLYVSGPLGGSIKGHHLTFTPRIEQGMFLAQTPEVTACMDLTDGLAKDAPSLAGPKLCVMLDVDDIPPSAETLEMCAEHPEEMTAHVLCDGEDYELLFAVKPEAADNFEAAWQNRFGGPVFRIGTLATRKPDDPLIVAASTGAPLTQYHGYEHLG